MGFRINTNVAALNAHNNGVINNRGLDNSLEKLSSGLRINKAADDASGMAIADSLRSQASSLGQAINNANDAVNIIQIADKAMDEQLKILDTVKTKAIQAAQDGQTKNSRTALQQDVNRLLEQLDNISAQTVYNGQNLLDGSFSNKEFQVGAYNNQTIRATIGDTSTSSNGATSFRSITISSLDSATIMTFSVDGVDYKLAPINGLAGDSNSNGIKELADQINKTTQDHGVRASWQTQMVFTQFSEPENIVSLELTNLTINGIPVGSFSGQSLEAGDSDGTMVNAINSVKGQTGIEAYMDLEGNLVLNSIGGRGIELTGTRNAFVATAGDTAFMANFSTETAGRLTLNRMDAKSINFTASSFTADEGNSTIANLSEVRGTIKSAEALSMGHVTFTGVVTAGAAYTAGSWSNINYAEGAGTDGYQVGLTYTGQIDAVDSGIGVTLTTMTGAQATISIAESAIKNLDSIRSDLGAVQNQLFVTIDNTSVTQVNVKSAESTIRDVDFAQESATFAKHNILAQSGTYAMSQANSVQEYVTQLLQ